MKKIIASCFLFLIIAGGVLLSYSIAKKRAENAARENSFNISPLKGQLVLFINDGFSPCWVFRGEYEDVLTGATFDVFVSIFGKVIMVPKKIN